MVRGMHGMVPAMTVLGLSTLALAAEPATEDLKAQIDALQRKVEALEAKQVSSADVDATVRRVLEDAERRSQLMDVEGFTAGYNKGKFTIQSADGNFSFSPTAQLQIRYDGSYREDAPKGSSYDDGFEIRRAKFGFVGNAVSPDLTYKFQWATGRNNGGTNASVYLEDAWVRYRLNENWLIFGGQMEDPISHEALTSSSRQMAVESSLTNSLLIEGVSDYIQGVGALYELNKNLRVQGLYHDGAGSQNTDFRNANGNYWGATARAEWMVIGDNWKQYDDFSALGNKSDLLVLGAGADYTQGDDRDLTLFGVDAQWEPLAVAGLSVYGGIVGQLFEANDAENGVSAENQTNLGYVVQVAYAFNARWEIFGRFDEIVFDSDAQAEGVEDQVQEITLGVNYYINGHAAKLTADIGYLPNGFDSGLRDLNGSAFSATGAGVLPTTGDSDEFVARVQFQLLL